MLADGRADGGLDDNDDKARRERASGLQYFVIPPPLSLLSLASSRDDEGTTKVKSPLGSRPSCPE